MVVVVVAVVVVVVVMGAVVVVAAVKAPWFLWWLGSRGGGCSDARGEVMAGDTGCASVVECCKQHRDVIKKTTVLMEN